MTPPKSPASAPSTRGAHLRARSASASAGREGACGQSRRSANGAACAERRCGSGDRLCREGSRNGGFISTRSAAPGGSPAAAKSGVAARTSSTHARARGHTIAARILGRKRASAGSRSTRVTRTSSTRRATARPAAPTPAPSSTRCSPAAPRSPPQAESHHGRPGGRGAAGAD